MRQVFLLSAVNQSVNLENQDALPLSDRLWYELETRFPCAQSPNKAFFSLSATQALELFRDFYARYELSQPQRRVRLRLEDKLVEMVPDQVVQFIIAEVSEHRNRRKLS